MIKYPNGKLSKLNNSKKLSQNSNSNLHLANRGMGLENDLNFSNAKYLEQGRAVIYKRPTPIKIIKVDYSKGAKIIDAVFEKQSTTDYNGIYRGKYLDFEAKSTQNKTSFPFNNIGSHQINHLKAVIKQGGITFFIISFTTLDRIYLVDASLIIAMLEENKKSITETFLRDNCTLIVKKGLNFIDYLQAVDEQYF